MRCFRDFGVSNGLSLDSVLRLDFMVSQWLVIRSVMACYWLLWLVMACYWIYQWLVIRSTLRRGGALCKLNSVSFFGVSAANGLLLVVSVGWLRRGGAYCKLNSTSFFEVI